MATATRSKSAVKNPPPITEPAMTKPTSGNNRYEALNHDKDISTVDNSDAESQVTVISNQSKKRKMNPKENDNPVHAIGEPPKPPPINIRGLKHDEVCEIMRSISKAEKDFNIQFSGKYTKVFAATSELHKKLKDKLQVEKSKFFTHQTREEQTTKVVLYNFYQTSTDELLEMLKKQKKSTHRK